MAEDAQYPKADRAAALDGSCLAVSAVLDLVANKWTILIYDLLQQRPMRFAELRRAIPRISSKMLTTTLQKLAAAGLATRTQYPEVPLRVEYRLTPLGETLVVPARDMLSWAKAHHAEIERNPAASGSKQEPDE